jgi:phosphoribosylglycinamide formyltransferase-1
MKWACLVGGRGSNLAALLQAGANIGLVLSHRAGVGALDIAAGYGVPAVVLEPDPYPSREAYDAAILATLRQHRIDALVLAGFLRKLGPVVVQAYRERAINVHPSLLPAFPGLNAVRQAIRYGVRVTGVSVHFVDEGLDSGPLIAQEALAVHDDDTEETLHARLQVLEHRLLPAAVAALDQGRLVVEGRRVRWVIETPNK